MIIRKITKGHHFAWKFQLLCTVLISLQFVQGKYARYQLVRKMTYQETGTWCGRLIPVLGYRCLSFFDSCSILFSICLYIVYQYFFLIVFREQVIHFSSGKHIIQYSDVSCIWVTIFKHCLRYNTDVCITALQQIRLRIINNNNKLN